MLYRLDLHVVPIFDEIAQDAAMVAEIAIEVRGPFPNANGSQVRGLLSGHLPLVHAVIGDPVEPYLAVGPALLPSPFDAVVHVTRLLGAPQGHETW